MSASPTAAYLTFGQSKRRKPSGCNYSPRGLNACSSFHVHSPCCSTQRDLAITSEIVSFLGRSCTDLVASTRRMRVTMQS